MKTETKVQPTPTPWKISKWIDGEKSKGLSIVSENKTAIANMVFQLTDNEMANAAFIVRACNRDQSNMECLYELSKLLNPQRTPEGALALCDKIESIICDALARAEARP